MNNKTNPAFDPKLARHLLAALAEPGAFARHSALREGELALFRVRRGLTLGAGQLPESQSMALIEAGFVAWTRVGRHRQLVISAAGLAALHRGHVPTERILAGEGAAGAARPNKTVGIDPPRTVAVNLKESPLAWLYRRTDGKGRRQISESQFLAGERLRADLERAQMLPRVTTNWAAPVSGSSPGAGPDSANDTVIAARQRVSSACTAVSPEFSGLLIDVCGFLKGLEQVERERGWPARSAKLLLRMGLDRLAAHYGIVSGENAAQKPPRARVWRGADARPTKFPALSQPAPRAHRP